MTAARRRADGGRLSIGAVLELLRAEFPEVTISKIRFLESEGLVHPTRTQAGYRQFADADVDRLRFVLAAQRDHYLPLKVIKSQLEALDRGDGQVGGGRQAAATRPVRPLASAPAAPSGRSFPQPDPGVAGRRLTQEQVLAESEITAGLLAELEQFGLVRSGPGGFYDDDTVQVAKAAAVLTGYGIEPRHLRAFRAAADREVGLITQIAAPVARQRDPDARARAEETMRELTGLSVHLHALLVKAGVREALGG